MDTQFFNSPLLGSLSLDSPVSSGTPKHKSSSGSPPNVSSKRSRNMHSLTPSDFVPRSLKWDSVDSCDSGFASFGSTSYALNFDLDGDIPDENDIEMPTAPSGFCDILRRPLRELSSNSTDKRTPLKALRRSRLQTTSEKRRAANSRVSSPSNNKTDTETLQQNSIKAALSLGDASSDLIADFSAPYALPRCKSKHSDLQGISPETVSNLIRGEYSEVIDNYAIVDCRYPYEYEGGHIEGAQNIYTKSDIFDRFMKSDEFTSKAVDSNKKNVIIFHCEFSSERGPKMCRYLRESDRKENADQYPRLTYPEIYILEGGYKAFYEHESSQCTPQTYKPMLHADHSQDLKHFRAKTKSMNGSRCNRRRMLRC